MRIISDETKLNVYVSNPQYFTYFTNLIQSNISDFVVVMSCQHHGQRHSAAPQTPATLSDIIRYLTKSATLTDLICYTVLTL